MAELCPLWTLNDRHTRLIRMYGLSGDVWRSLGGDSMVQAHFEAVNLIWSAAGKDPRLLIFASKVSEDLPT